MVLSWAVVHGVTFEESEAVIGGAEAGLLRGLRASGIGGEGTSGQLGAMVKNTPQALVDRLMLVCCCCGRVGSACEAGAAAATSAAATAAAAPEAAAGGAAEGAPNTPAQDAVLQFLCAFTTESIAAGRAQEGGGAAGAGALGPASKAAMRRVLAECARERGPAVLLFYCGRCKRAMYCSEACQKRAWAEHKLSCRAPEGGGE